MADQLLDGLAALVIDGYAAAAPELERALDAFRERELPADAWLRWVPHAAHTALLLWDFESWQAIAEQQVAGGPRGRDAASRCRSRSAPGSPSTCSPAS